MGTEALSHRERETRLKRIQEGLVRSAAWMLEPSEEHTASAIIVVASVLQDLLRVGGAGSFRRANEQLAQLVEEGVLAP